MDSVEADRCFFRRGLWCRRVRTAMKREEAYANALCPMYDVDEAVQARSAR